MQSVGTLFSFGCFILLFIVIGVVASRRGTGTESDYILGSRSFGRIFIGLSAGSASASGFLMVGASGSGYAIGLSALVIPIGYFLGDLVFWLFFPARLNRVSRTYALRKKFSSSVIIER